MLHSIAFIDYQKAFDTVSHHSIWKSLEAQNVEKSYIDVIRKVYGKCTSRVKLETTGPTFPVERGVRQGDPLSPRIFIAILETALGELDWSKKGLYIKGKYLSHLRFADDLVLFSESSSQLQVMIEDLCKTSRQWAGHVARLKDGRWTHKITSWKGPEGKRCRGRPFARWEEDIKKIAGPKWQQIAQNRENWQKLEEAFT
ncbi:Retrovirus-related Pol polyprotein from type-2 retrotransposable element R2DM; Endonuclease [Eumeta japonica]|uniref:Retrovirus-related Pol polyprotein from type-2 retrotransposable element R2DM Endonuclease n=1 Tax=Eumeta variegata TaxID=151549 RepID=A0A4C1VJ59_EUMVA|nr:Retrovirus-related Pol polyprotein from type-2 retrotransposable element R2DM; Endonuclease [Eumeta japonica]